MFTLSCSQKFGACWIKPTCSSVKLAQKHEVLLLWCISLPGTLGHSVVCGENPTCLSRPYLSEEPGTKHIWPCLLVPVGALPQFHVFSSVREFLFSCFPFPSFFSCLSSSCLWGAPSQPSILVACYMWLRSQVPRGAYTLIKNVWAPAVCRHNLCLLRRIPRSETRSAYQLFRCENLVLQENAV